MFEDVALDDVFDGLGAYHSISFTDDLDAGFAQLLERVLGVPYLAVPYLAVAYLAVPERRGSGSDRRVATVEQRLRIGMWKQFADTTGRGEYEEFGNDDPPIVPAARRSTAVPSPSRSVHRAAWSRW